MLKFTNILEAFALRPMNLRVNFFRRLILKTKLLPYDKCLEYDLVPRPSYGYCIYNAAKLALSLGYSKISVIEFGVAGGNGLVNVEFHVKQIPKKMDIDIEVYGFDAGIGLPPPEDYRDVPYIWGEGFYKMDVPALEKSLEFSKLVIGDVRETAGSFFDKYKPAPVACVLFDLDYYSSTKAALGIFEGDPNNYLPRVHCYFDDLLNEYIGAYGALTDFNKSHDDKKLANIFGLSFGRVPHHWGDNIFVLHDFVHPRYSDRENQESDQIHLNVDQAVGYRD